MVYPLSEMEQRHPKMGDPGARYISRTQHVKACVVAETSMGGRCARRVCVGEK